MTSDPTAARYRRRRRWPVAVVVAVLLVAAGVIWFQALKPEPQPPAGCNAPGPAPSTAPPTTRSQASRSPASGSSTRRTTPVTSITTVLGSFSDKNTLAGVRPANPNDLLLTVFNASQQNGIATSLTDELRSVGFESLGKGANDPLYPAGDLRCVGEIRYGNAGVRGARTALLIMPCAQLVVDGRVDDSVDIAVGQRYVFAEIPDEVKNQLKAIADADTPPAVIDGRTVANQRSAPPIPPLPTADCPA